MISIPMILDTFEENIEHVNKEVNGALSPALLSLLASSSWL